MQIDINQKGFITGLPSYDQVKSPDSSPTMQIVETHYICKSCTSTFFNTPEGNCPNCADNAWITKEKKIKPNTTFHLASSVSMMNTMIFDNPPEYITAKKEYDIAINKYPLPKKTFWRKVFEFLGDVAIGIVFGSHIITKK